MLVEVDGTFEGRRTVGGARVGSFRGRLMADRLEALRLAGDTAAAGSTLSVATPLDGATETVEVAGVTAQLGSNERPTGTWKPLIDAVRGLVDDELVAAPLAALELAATAHEASLTHAGSAPIEVDVASVTIRAVRLDAQGSVLGRWQGAALPDAAEDSRAAAGDWTTADGGWRQALPFAHGLELAPGDWLQVWVFARIRDVAGDRVERAARLFVAVPG